MAYSKHSKNNNCNCFVDSKASKCRTRFVKLVFRGIAHIFDNFVSIGILARGRQQQKHFAKIFMLQNVRTDHAFTKNVTFLKLGALNCKFISVCALCKCELPVYSTVAA